MTGSAAARSASTKSSSWGLALVLSLGLLVQLPTLRIGLLRRRLRTPADTAGPRCDAHPALEPVRLRGGPTMGRIRARRLCVTAVVDGKRLEDTLLPAPDEPLTAVGLRSLESRAARISRHEPRAVDGAARARPSPVRSARPPATRGDSRAARVRALARQLVPSRLDRPPQL